MNTYISDKGIKILKELKNKTFIRIIADDWRDYNRSCGNIKIDFEDCSIEIENDYRNVSYFGVNEELAGYDVMSKMLISKIILFPKIKNLCWKAAFFAVCEMLSV